MKLSSDKDAELVAISNSTSIIEGQTALFSCIGWGQSSIQITWAHNEQSVINSTSLSISEEDVVQNERTFMHSVLKVCSVQLDDAGAYSCLVSSGEISVNSSTQLNVFSKFFIFTLGRGNHGVGLEGGQGMTTRGYGSHIRELT